jgi:predicted Holliday junction resolvase-like endonuclease
MAIDILIVLVVFLSLILWLVVDLLQSTRHNLKSTSADLHDTLGDLDKANAVIADLAVKFTPLLEQTDWMTGRWGGKFNQLVTMEKDRNTAVVSARAALFNAPFMQEATRQALPALSMTATDYEGRNFL